MTKFRYPTSEEVRAMELAARRARARELARLARVAVSAIAQLPKLINGRRVRHA